MLSEPEEIPNDEDKIVGFCLECKKVGIERRAVIVFKRAKLCALHAINYILQVYFKDIAGIKNKKDIAFVTGKLLTGIWKEIIFNHDEKMKELMGIDD